MKKPGLGIFLNFDGLFGIESAAKSGADGIGLLRSEFLFLASDGFPSENEQFNAYKMALLAMPEKPVIIRTFDFGADKGADFLGLGYEENPALGLRGIRLCLARPDLFKTQLRALLKASVYGRLSILFPMITEAFELYEAKCILNSVKAELKRESIPFSDFVKTGIMIETPAAALTCDELSAMSDFFSIGTNDLTQYTLACDRENGAIDNLYNQKHKAVFKLISAAIESAKRAKIPSGICGELARDTSLTADFIKMGIDYLSVPIGDIASLKEAAQNL